MAEDGGIRVTRSLVIPADELRFSFTTSGGPGGQHANKAATRAEVAWNIEESRALGPRQRERLRRKLGRRLDSSGTVRVASGTYRSQLRNREAVVTRLADVIRTALTEPRRRVATAPSGASVERRLQAKRRRSELKRRRRVREED